ncbi:hypothetical protein GCM10029978_051750 [Actinoallomurus acanthiterrae]
MTRPADSRSSEIERQIDEADVSAADQRTALPSRGRWCRATWVLVGTATVWLLVVLSGRWWPSTPLDFLPPLAYVAVPVMLLVAIPLVRAIRAPIPIRPRLLIVAMALAALALALPVRLP